MTTRHRLGTGGMAVFVLGAALLAGPLGAPAAADARTLKEIENAVGGTAVKADYVVLADTSQSMRQDNRYGGLKTGLRDFLAALAPTDHLTLITFDATTTPAYSGEVGTNPDAVIGKLPPAATGQATDIGAAIEAAVTDLERPGAAAIATVVLITDGQHEPQRGSHYPLAQGYAWEQLRLRVSQLKKTNLTAYALSLGGVTGAGLLSTVFPGATTLDSAPIDQVTRQLEAPKQAVNLAKMRSALADHTRPRVEVAWPAGLGSVHAGRNELTVRLTAADAKVPLTVSDLRFTVAGADLAVEVGRSPVELAPGQSVDLPVVVSWDPGPRGWAFADEATLTADLSVTATVTSRWADTMRDDLGLTLEPDWQPTTGAVRGTAELGRPEAYLGGGATVVLLLAAVLLWRYRRPSLRGVLAVTAPPPTSHVRDVPLPRRRHATLTSASTGQPEPVDLRLRRADGGLRLRLTVGTDRARTSKLLRPASGVTIRGVGYAWHSDAAGVRVTSSVAPPIPPLPPIPTAPMPVPPATPSIVVGAVAVTASHLPSDPPSGEFPVVNEPAIRID